MNNIVLGWSSIITYLCQARVMDWADKTNKKKQQYNYSGVDQLRYCNQRATTIATIGTLLR